MLSEALSLALNVPKRDKKIIILIFQIKKQRYKDTEFLFQGHTAIKHWRVFPIPSFSQYIRLAVLNILPDRNAHKKDQCQSPTPSDSNFIGMIEAGHLYSFPCPLFLMWESLIDSIYFHDTC